MPYSFWFLLFFLWASLVTGQTVHYDSAYNLLQPKPQWIGEVKHKVRVAIIDDAFRLSHKQLERYWSRNLAEIPGNRIDDDGNGYIDDVLGWDFADSDSDVRPAEGKESYFYHGTMVAGIIARWNDLLGGDDKESRIELIPIKILSDHTSAKNYSKGYAAIDYAIVQQADVLVLPWSGGSASSDDIRLVQRAQQAGLAIFCSAGNTYSNKLQHPASLGGMFVVGAVDEHGFKLASSNFGPLIDWVAPGEKVKAPHASADNAWFYGDGTSAAVGMVAGAFATLQAYFPEAGNLLLYEAMLNTALPLDSLNVRYRGQLGSGMPQWSDAYQYLHQPEQSHLFHLPERSKGMLRFKRGKIHPSYALNPGQGFESIHFEQRSDLEARSGASWRVLEGEKLRDEIPLAYIPITWTHSGEPSDFTLNGSLKKDWIVQYAYEPVDYASLYCSGLQVFSLDSGLISDGSGEMSYSGESSCYWQIEVPAGMRIKIEFIKLDTEANVDFVYLFSGDKTLQENLLAKFSGANLPPIVVSPFHQVLVWFVSDAKGHGQGWEFVFRAVDEKPGYYQKESFD